jgi:Pentapeptide repeats (8 copies)
MLYSFFYPTTLTKMTERLNSVEELRKQIRLECKEVFDSAFEEAAKRAFEKVEEFSKDRLLPVEKKMIFFQTIVSDLQDYNYDKYRKKGSRGYTILEKFSIMFFNIRSFVVLLLLGYGLSCYFLGDLEVEERSKILFSALIPCLSLLVVYFGAGVVSKRTIESAFVKEIDDMFVRINTNWNIFSAVLSKRDDLVKTNEHDVKCLTGNYGMTGVLEFFASLVGTPYALEMTGFQLQGLDLQGGNFEQITLPQANCTCTDFRGADLRKAKFNGATLDYAIFDGAKLSQNAFDDVASCEHMSLNNVIWFR